MRYDNMVMEGVLIGYCTLKDKGYKVIAEGLIKTYPIDNAIWHIKECFQLSDSENLYNVIINSSNRIETEDANGVIKKAPEYNGSESVFVLLPGDFKQLEFVKDHFKVYGYFEAYTKDYESGWVEHKFEKKFDTDITEPVKELGYLYHICSEESYNKIKIQGLIPKESKWLSYNNDPRVYFFLHDLDDATFEHWANDFDNNKVTKSNTYCLLKIDLSKVNNNPTFYNDPRMNDGTYTFDAISPEAITLEKQIKI